MAKLRKLTVKQQALAQFPIFPTKLPPPLGLPILATASPPDS